MKKSFFVLAGLLAIALFAVCKVEENTGDSNRHEGTFTASEVTATLISGSGSAEASLVSGSKGTVWVYADSYKVYIPINYSASSSTDVDNIDGVSADVTINMRDGACYNGDTKLSVSGSIGSNSFTIQELSVNFGFLTKSKITFKNLKFVRAQ